MNVAYNNKTITICIKINNEISEVDHYTWIFTSRIFRPALEITFALNKYLFLQMAYELLSQSRKPNKREGPNKRGESENLLKKKISGGTLIRNQRVFERATEKSTTKLDCREIFSSLMANLTVLASLAVISNKS